jgi:high-affinity iron transporter
MSPAFMLTLRLGLEAFVMVAVLHAYVERTTGRQLLPAIRRGTAASVPLSVLAATALAAASNEALWVGLAELFTAALVSCVIWAVLRRGRWTSHGAGAALIVVTVVTIARAGMEVATLFGSVIFQLRSVELSLQASAGVLVAAALASGWIVLARRIELDRLLKVTLLFCGLFVAQLVIYGFHELTEANVVPFSEPLHWATEPYGPDGRYGKHFSILLVLVPLAYVSFSMVMQRPSWGQPYVKSRGPAARV